MSHIENTVTGQGLIDKFGFDEYALAYYAMRYGLSVIDPEQFKTSIDAPPQEFNTLEEFNRYSIDPQELVDMIQDDPTPLKGKIFYIPDTEKIPLMFDAVRKPKEVPEEEGLRYMTERHQPDLRDNPNYFALAGENWAVRFKAEEFGIFLNRKEIKPIPELLAYYSQHKTDKKYKYSINSIDFLAKFNPDYATTGDETDTLERAQQDISPKESDEDNESKGIESSEFSEIISQEDAEKIEEFGNKLLSDLKAATISGVQRRIDECNDEIDNFRKTCIKEYKVRIKMSPHCEIVKKYEKVSEHFEKARQLLKNQKNAAIKRFEENGMPRLSRHLFKSITPRKKEIEYAPEELLDWYIKF